jgi:Gram-negative bacterial TonB protein C-terminal
MDALYNLKSLTSNRERLVFKIAIFISIVLHLMLLLMPRSDFFKISSKPSIEKTPEPVTIVFPENKPKLIVENINENKLRPDNSDLLSDQDSRARNPQLLADVGNQPYSNGFLPFENLTNPQNPALSSTPTIKKFNRKDLGKKGLDEPEESSLEQFQNEEERPDFLSDNEPYNPDQNYAQKKFSADELGDLSLSTYAWEWAPYINAFKHKLYEVWFPPVAYNYLGIIYGHTVIQFSISRDGQLLWYKVLEQQGHESLQQSSVNAIVAVFPFKPLPDNFPDKQLTITARLIYPNLREVQQ